MIAIDDTLDADARGRNRQRGSRAMTCTSSTPHAATPVRNASGGVTASPGHPFCTGPSITKC